MLVRHERPGHGRSSGHPFPDRRSTVGRIPVRPVGTRTTPAWPPLRGGTPARTARLRLDRSGVGDPVAVARFAALSETPEVVAPVLVVGVVSPLVSTAAADHRVLAGADRAEPGWSAVRSGASDPSSATTGPDPSSDGAVGTGTDGTASGGRTGAPWAGMLRTPIDGGRPLPGSLGIPLSVRRGRIHRRGRLIPGRARSAYRTPPWGARRPPWFPVNRDAVPGR